MARGHKTGGRQRGSRNHATAEARAAAEATGVLPLDYMLTVMRDPNADQPGLHSFAVGFFRRPSTTVSARKPLASMISIIAEFLLDVAEDEDAAPDQPR